MSGTPGSRPLPLNILVSWSQNIEGRITIVGRISIVGWRWILEVVKGFLKGNIAFKKAEMERGTVGGGISIVLEGWIVILWI